ncbi:hypothetical protein LZ641_09880 [Hafnia paralvei]|uniref:hypothetical protein n=1 Tax=Hafnia paralvei TaxID=546367 RepID=UPI001F2DB61D|nr:hypothetical protein [Hafnia paralvei]MCE9880649.1 hypothetical protein [Hafnia paralvei]MCE9906152.1 hypothetical protein [Hafnia paralvei]MCE9910459.1 hypothetical protein [Hafnia paralvei]
MKKKFLLATALFLTGCAAQVPVVSTQVDGKALDNALGKRHYILFPDNPKINAHDLSFMEYKKYVMRILDSRGMTPSTDFNSADIAIFLGYGIGEPKTHTYTYSSPVWGQTGISSSNTYGTVSTYGNNSTYSSNTTYTPTYGVTGYTQNVGSVTYFTRYASLNAYDVQAYKKDKSMIPVWSTTAISVGESGDLRKVMPYMLYAMQPYIGKSTGGNIEVNTSEDDPYILSELSNLNNIQSK